MTISSGALLGPALSSSRAEEAEPLRRDDRVLEDVQARVGQRVVLQPVAVVCVSVGIGKAAADDPDLALAQRELADRVCVPSSEPGAVPGRADDVAAGALPRRRSPRRVIGEALLPIP